MAEVHPTLKSKSTVMPSGCVDWTGGYLMPNGYAVVRIGPRKDGKRILVHRLSYKLSVGEIPEGMHVCHHCDNRRCINPDHLFLGTNYDNILDRMKKGRSHGNKGEAHPFVKLTAEQVLKIRTDDRPYAVIGAEYGITPQHAGRVRRAKNWKSLP